MTLGHPVRGETRRIQAPGLEPAMYSLHSVSSARDVKCILLVKRNMDFLRQRGATIRFMFQKI